MKVEVLYFAVLRERIRLDQETVELPAGASVADARAAIATRHP
jgi:molybdopterin converting factor small subunit